MCQGDIDLALLTYRKGRGSCICWSSNEVKLHSSMVFLSKHKHFINIQICSSLQEKSPAGEDEGWIALPTWILTQHRGTVLVLCFLPWESSWVWCGLAHEAGSGAALTSALLGIQRWAGHSPGHSLSWILMQQYRAFYHSTSLTKHWSCQHRRALGQVCSGLTTLREARDLPLSH